MGMPKKGSRKIVVDDKTYRWSLRCSRYCDLDDDIFYRVGALTIQSEMEKPGRVCQTFLSWIGDESVTPEAIAIVIRKALSLGWNPEERGTAFKFKSVNLGELPLKIDVIKFVMES